MQIPTNQLKDDGKGKKRVLFTSRLSPVPSPRPLFVYFQYLDILFEWFKALYAVLFCVFFFLSYTSPFFFSALLLCGLG